MAGTGASYGLDKGFRVNSAVGELNRFRVVKLNTSGEIVLATSTSDLAVGVVQEQVDAAKVATGKVVADVRVLGISKVVAAGALSVGALVTPTTGGKVTGAIGGNKAVGIVVGGPAAQDGDIVEVLLTPGAVA